MSTPHTQDTPAPLTDAHQAMHDTRVEAYDWARSLEFHNEQLIAALAAERAVKAELVAACEIALHNLTPKYSSAHVVMVKLRAALARANEGSGK